MFNAFGLITTLIFVPVCTWKHLGSEDERAHYALYLFVTGSS